MNTIQLNELKALIYNVGIKTWKKRELTSADHTEIDANIKYIFNRLDDLGVSFKVQNACISVAQSMDIRTSYLSDMLKMALARAGVAA